jgi:hypothetical protein
MATKIEGTEYRAADLPEGSVVASERTIWLAGRGPEGRKRPMERFLDGGRWLTLGYDTDDGSAVATDVDDDEMDQRLTAGAQVLRVGTGQGG